MGAPKLHEWTASPKPHLRTMRISSRVAPASSAARIWRRVPSSSRFVQEQFSAREISSTSLRGRTPLVHGFVPTRSSSSAPLGSHSLSLSKDEPQGSAGRAVDDAFVATVSVAIFPPFSRSTTTIGSGMTRHRPPSPSLFGPTPHGLWGASDVHCHWGGYQDSMPIKRTDPLRHDAPGSPDLDSRSSLCP